MGGSINSVLGFSGVRLDGKEVDAWYVKFDKKIVTYGVTCNSTG